MKDAPGTGSTHNLRHVAWPRALGSRVRARRLHRYVTVDDLEMHLGVRAVVVGQEIWG